MTAINVGNCAIAEVRVNGVVHSRRSCHWTEITSCYPVTSACDYPNGVPLNPADYVNIMHKKWIDLPAGANTIEVYGLRMGRSSVESQIEVAVWRKECPPVMTDVICVPASVIAEQGLCEFERLAAIHGAMVGCIQVSSNCQQGPDVYTSGPCCLETRCKPEGNPGEDECDGCQPNDPPNPGGGWQLNLVSLNYPYDVRVAVEWETAFVQDTIGQCDCTTEPDPPILPPDPPDCP